MNHEQIINYNFDDDLTLFIPVVENPLTAFGSALLLYWRLEGLFLKEENCSSNKLVWQLNQDLKNRLCSDFYKKSDIAYNPIEDNGLNIIQINKFIKSGENKILFSVAGNRG